MSSPAKPPVRFQWFSPLPPARTGIADYTAQLLPYLTEEAEVVLWTDQEEWDPAVESFAPVRRFSSDAVRRANLTREDNCINVPLFHIGNNGPLHQAIWEASQIVPGIAVLHDTRLQHLFAHILRDVYQNSDMYVAAMERYYGAEGRRAAQRFCAGEHTTEHMAERFSLASLAVQNSLAAIVHSPEGLRLLTGEGYGAAEHIDFPYAARPESPVRPPGPPFRIVICGYLGPNRRLDSFLSALAAFDRKNAFLVEIYGPVWDPPYIQKLIKSGGLSHIVSLNGFMPLREIDKALAGAHLAVNLRYPTMGEASMSQLQLWDHGIPSLVTPVGWYAEAPPETVLYVHPEREMEDIQRHLADFLEDPARFSQIGDTAREVLRTQHDPRLYVSRLIQFAELYRSFRLKRTALSAATRTASDMRQWLPSSCLQLASARVSEEIAVLFTPVSAVSATHTAAGQSSSSTHLRQ
jgi:glycosyltransferase involved in cell wall biosynthesis